MSRNPTYTSAQKASRGAVSRIPPTHTSSQTSSRLLHTADIDSNTFSSLQRMIQQNFPQQRGQFQQGQIGGNNADGGQPPVLVPIIPREVYDPDFKWCRLVMFKIIFVGRVVMQEVFGDRESNPIPENLKNKNRFFKFYFKGKWDYNTFSAKNLSTGKDFPIVLQTSPPYLPEEAPRQSEMEKMGYDATIRVDLVNFIPEESYLIDQIKTSFKEDATHFYYANVYLTFTRFKFLGHHCPPINEKWTLSDIEIDFQHGGGGRKSW